MCVKYEFFREGRKSGAKWKLMVTMEVDVFENYKREET